MKGKIFGRNILSIGIALAFLLSGLAYAYEEHNGGNVSGTWSGTHYISASVAVADDETLALEAGTVVKFAPYTTMNVYGTLDASGGTSTNNIVFTSRDDDSCGDIIPGFDGSPSPGDWYGILLQGWDANDGVGNFNWCRIRYGGSNSQYWGNVYFYGSDSGSLTNCTIEESQSYGVNIYGASGPTLRGNLIQNNTSYGVCIQGGTPNLGNNDLNDKGMNTIRDNDSGGSQYQVCNGSYSAINAYYNFWNSTDPAWIDARIRDNEEGAEEVFFIPFLTQDESLGMGNEPDLTLASDDIGFSKNPATFVCSDRHTGADYRYHPKSRTDSRDW